MKNITVSDEVVEMIDKLGIDYDEGNIQYKDNVWHIVPVMTGACLALGAIALSAIMYGIKNDMIFEHPCPIPTPTLTGEYGNPDGWEALTGPYLDVQTIQIQELQKENDMLKEANRIIDGKLKSEKRCGDVQCGTIVWFIDGHTIASGRIVFYVDEEIKEGEIGGYEIQTEEQYHDEYYIGFNRILPKSDIYKSKNELLKTIKGM